MDKATRETNEKEQQPACPACGGSGQIGEFRGESRFLISWEECFDCCGTGLLLNTPQQEKKK